MISLIRQNQNTRSQVNNNWPTDYKFGFKGVGLNAIETATQISSNSTTHVLISALSTAILRPLIIMQDEETSKDERIYASAWQAGISLVGIPILIGPGEKMVENFADDLTHTVYGIKRFEPYFVENGLFRETQQIIDSLKTDPNNSYYNKLARLIEKVQKSSLSEQEKKLRIARILIKPEKLVIDNDSRALPVKHEIHSIYRKVFSGKKLERLLGEDNLFLAYENIKRAADPSQRIKERTIFGRETEVSKLRRFIQTASTEEKALIDVVTSYNHHELNAEKVFKQSLETLKDQLSLPSTGQYAVEDVADHIGNIKVALEDHYLQSDIKLIESANDTSEDSVKKAVKKVYTAIFGKEVSINYNSALEEIQKYKRIYDYDQAQSSGRNFGILERYLEKLDYRRKILNPEKVSAPEAIEILENHVPKLAGSSKIVKLITTVLTAALLGTLMTRYLGRGINYTSEKLTGKKLNVERKKTPKEKQTEKRIDNVLLAMGAGLVGALGLFKFGNKLQAVKSLKKSVGDFISKNTEFIRKSKSEWSAKQMGHKADGDWLTRSVLFNLFFRILVTLPTGQYYNTVRCVVDEGLILGSFKLVDRSKIIPKGNNILSKLTNPKRIAKQSRKSQAGIDFILDQSIKNIGIVSVGSVFMNNEISYRILSKLTGNKKEEKNNFKEENKYQKLKKQLIVDHFLHKNYQNPEMPLFFCRPENKRRQRNS